MVELSGVHISGKILGLYIVRLARRHGYYIRNGFMGGGCTQLKYNIKFFLERGSFV